MADGGADEEDDLIYFTMSTSLAIDGGTPVRETLLPYSRQSVSAEDIQAVTEVLQSDWLTTGEGGMITTDNPHFPQAMRQFRNHCLTSDHRERHKTGSWFYEMTKLGYNYRLTDIQCALGISQLKKVPAWTVRRQEIASLYDAAFEKIDAVNPLTVREGISHAYHLYVVKLNTEVLTVTRADIFQALRAENIGVNVHYIPVHLHPFYQERFGTKSGTLPIAEKAYEHILSLPIFAGMSDNDANDVIEAVKKVCAFYRK